MVNMSEIKKASNKKKRKSVENGKGLFVVHLLFIQFS